MECKMICRREEGDSVRSCFYKQTLLGEVCICAWRTVLLLYLHVRAGPACCWWAWAWGRRPTASSSGSPGPESRGAGRSCRAAGAPLCRPPPISLYSTVGRRQTVSQSVSQSVTEIYRIIFPQWEWTDCWPAPPTETGVLQWAPSRG